MLTDSFVAIEYDISLEQAKGCRAVAAMSLLILSTAESEEQMDWLKNPLSGAVSSILMAIDPEGVHKLTRAYKVYVAEAQTVIEEKLQ